MGWRTRAAFDTRPMRAAVAVALVVCSSMIVVPSAPASAPVLRVVPGPTLVVAGAGFVPRTLVRLRLTRSGVVVRTTSVRAGGRGGFVVRLPGIEACATTLVTATGVQGRRPRVPASWFVRECPPPPPLAPALGAA